MNIHTTPQTVGTHNNTHQYIKIWQRGSCQLVSFLGCIHHTHTHGIARIGFCPPWKGPEGVVHKHMFFPTWVEKTKPPAEFLCGLASNQGQGLCCFYILSRNFPVCVVVLIYVAIPSSINHAPRCFACANSPTCQILGEGGGGWKTWAQIRMLKS